MLEAVELLGKMVGGEDIIVGIIEDVRGISKASEESLYLVKLDFREEGSGTLRLHFDLEEIPKDPEKRREFLIRWWYVGNASGNNPQRFLTTNFLRYLTGQVIPNLLRELSDQGEECSELAQKLRVIHEKAFSRVDGGKAVLDLERLGITVEKKGKAREWDEQVAKALTEPAEEKFGIPGRRMRLWTLLFNGKPLVQLKPYDQVILRYRLAGFKGEGSVSGTCMVCGKEKEKVMPRPSSV